MTQRRYEIVLNGTPEENAAEVRRIVAAVKEQDPDAVIAAFLKEPDA